MPSYLLAVVYPPEATQPPPDELAQIMDDVNAVKDQMQSAGVWVFGGGLHDPSTATTVRERDGEVVTTDGPFIESKEVLGGVTIIEAADLDEALMWAGKQARAIPTVPIEVRPFMD